MSNDQLNWNDLANTKMSEVERPPLKPAGHYQAVITGRGVQGQSAKKGTLFVTFPIQVQAPMEDVDLQELEAANGAQFKSELTFWFTPTSLWRFKEFSVGLGASDDLGVLEAVEYLATCGEPFVVEARHQPNENNPEQIFLRIENPVPLSRWEEKQAAKAA